MSKSANARVSRIILMMWLGVSALAAESKIFVSRHADRYGTEPDPTLTEIGEKQADLLSRMLAAANVTRETLQFGRVDPEEERNVAVGSPRFQQANFK